MDELRYDTFIKNDKNENQALEIYQTAHCYIIHESAFPSAQLTLEHPPVLQLKAQQ